MTMPHLPFAPDQDSYQQTDGTEVAYIPLEGGPGRFRRDIIGAARNLNVRWTLTPWEYQYFRTFWNTVLLRGVVPFTCDLVGDDGCGPVPHSCLFVPGSMGMPSQSGLTYVLAASLEVTPLPLDPVADAAVIAAFEASVS